MILVRLIQNRALELVNMQMIVYIHRGEHTFYCMRMCNGNLCQSRCSETVFIGQITLYKLFCTGNGAMYGQLFNSKKTGIK